MHEPEVIEIDDDDEDEEINDAESDGGEEEVDEDEDGGGDEDEEEEVEESGEDVNGADSVMEDAGVESAESDHGALKQPIFLFAAA